MPVYTWKGKTRQGTVTAGVMEAANEETVMTQLRGQMLTPIKVKAKSKDISEYLGFLKQSITTKDLVIFTRQFATMIDAGLPLVQCLKILGDQQENPTFKAIIREISSSLAVSSTLAHALLASDNQQPRVLVDRHAGQHLSVQDIIHHVKGFGTDRRRPDSRPRTAKARARLPTLGQLQGHRVAGIAINN